MPLTRAQLRAFAKPDRELPAERMMTEISLGIPIEKSTAVRKGNLQDRELWNKLTQDIERIKREGGMIDYGIGT